MAFGHRFERLGFALLAIAASAALSWFGTGLFPMWPPMWLAPLPVLVFATRSSWWSTGLVALAAWAVGHLNMWYYFRATLHVPLLAVLGFVLAPAIVFALAVLLFRGLVRSGAWWGALTALPAAWVAFEYIFNLTSPHGTAISLAYSQLNCLPVLQLASLTGPWGISFLLLGFSSALAIGFHLRAADPKQALWILGATLSVLIGVLGFGAVRLAVHTPAHENVRVGLVASDLPQNRDVASPGMDTERLLHDYESQAEELVARGAEVVVLPEHVGELVDSRTATADAIFQSLADKTGATIVVGVSHVSTQSMHNQARVYTQRAQVASYNKQHLLPPFESRFAPGTALTTLREPTGKWGVAICKDMDFTQLSRQYGRDGVGLMLVPAWDFTLDRFGHGHIAVMRAVEDGFSLARAARGGFLTVSDNRGRILGETRSSSAPFATLLVTVPAIHDKTLYQLWGDWFAWVVLAVLAINIAQLARSRHKAH